MMDWQMMHATCPVCKAEYPALDMAYCPVDGNELDVLEAERKPEVWEAAVGENMTESEHMIKMENGKHCLYSKDGSKKLGCFDSHEEAVKREQQVMAFKHMGESFGGKLTLDAVRELCPACAQEMQKRNLKAIDVSVLAESERLHEQGFNQGMCDKFGPAEGMFTRCAAAMKGKVDDEKAFCAAMHEFCTGKFPAEESAIQESVHFDFRILERAGKTWDVVLIEEGVSKNGILYTEDVLKAAAPLFEGVKAYAYEFKGGLLDHLPETARDKLPDGFAKNLTGYYDSVKFGDYRKPRGEIARGLLGKFHVTASWLQDTLKNAWAKGKCDIVGFSIDALANVKEMFDSAGRKLKQAINFNTIDEVTVVSNPGAGGMLLNLVESTKQIKEVAHMKKLWAYLKEHFPKYLDGLQVNEENLEESETAILSVWEKIKTDLMKTAEPSADVVYKLVDEALDRKNTEASHLAASRELLRNKLKESSLPDPVKRKIEAGYWEMKLSEAQVNKVIKGEQEVLDQLAGAGVYMPGQTREEVKVTRDQEDKFGDAIEGMLVNDKVNGVEPFHSLHESYAKVTGYRGNAGQMGARLMNDLAHSMPAPLSLYLRESYVEALDEHRTRLRESRGTRLQEDTLQTSTWAEIFGDRMYKAMLKSYANQDFSDWEKIVSNIASVPDFKNQRRQRMGGFADLSTVAELGTYTEFTWPADEEVSYALSKYGNLAPLSMEALVNDDLKSLAQIPAKIGLAAKRTLYKFVFDFIRTNPNTDYDSVALFVAAHGNLGSTALSDTALDDVLFAMADQTELTSSEVLMNIYGKYILVPNELWRTAWEVVNATVSSTSGRTETVENWFSQFGLIPIRVPYWTDATDYAVIADPKQWDTIEIAFLNGRREPEIFIQDAPTVGSVFTADKITYKVRFIFGGDILDHRSMYKAVVS